MTKFGLNTKEKFLAELFQDPEVFYFGDELKEKLVSEFQISEANARQVVNRAAKMGIIRNTAPVSFGKKTYAYHSPYKRIKIEDLLRLSVQRRPPLYRLLNAIKTCGGILSYYEGLKIASTPLETSSSKTMLLEELIEELRVMKLADIRTDERNVKYIIASYLDEELIPGAMNLHFSRMTVDAIFIYDILQSLKSLNLIDNEQVIYRNRRSPSLGAQHNNFVWDAYGYTKTTGINTVLGSNSGTSSKAALVVLDVVVSRDYEDFDLDGFFARVQVLLNQTKLARKIIPLIVYHTISDETLNRAKNLGLITYSMKGFFGSRISGIIRDVTKIKNNEISGFIRDKDSVKLIDEGLKSIAESGHEENLQNLKGDFFQSLMYQLLLIIYPGGTIEQSRKLPALEDEVSKRKNYEYDFIITHPRTEQVIFFEVKGYKSTSIIRKGDYEKENTLKWFFNRTFPSGRKHYLTRPLENYKIRSVFITSAQFDDDGKEYLASLNKGDQKPEEIDTGYDGPKLLQLVEKYRLGLLKKTLERYFIHKRLAAQKKT